MPETTKLLDRTAVRLAGVLLLLAALVWCLGWNASGELWRWNGKEWRQVAEVPQRASDASAYVSPGGRIWLGLSHGLTQGEFSLLALRGGRWVEYGSRDFGGKFTDFAGVAFVGEQVWAAASEGVLHFDGHRWRTYKGVLNGPARAIDSDGHTVWVRQIYGGRAYFNGVEWRQILPPLKDEVLAAEAIGSSADRLWSGGYGNLSELDRAGNVLHRYTVDQLGLRRDDYVASVIAWRGGWIAAGLHDLAHFDGHTWRVIGSPIHGADIGRPAAEPGGTLLVPLSGLLLIPRAGVRLFVLAPLLIAALALWMRRVLREPTRIRIAARAGGLFGLMAFCMASLNTLGLALVPMMMLSGILSGILWPRMVGEKCAPLRLELRAYGPVIALMSAIVLLMENTRTGWGLLLAMLLLTLAIAAPLLLEWRIKRLMNAGRYTAALRWDRFSSSWTGSTLLRGRLLLYAGKLDAAETWVRDHLAVETTHGLLNQVGRVLLEQGRYEEAIATFEASRAKQPLGNEAPALQAEVYLRQGIEPERALKLIGRAAVVDPETLAEVESLRGWALAALGRDSEALAAFAQAFRHADPHVVPLQSLLHYRAGRALPRQCVRDFELDV